MNEQDYIKNRIDCQYEYYNKKGTQCKNRYQSLKFIVILLSVSIPLMTGFITNESFWLKVAIGLAGVVIALIEGIQSLYKFQDNWLLCRNAAEFLTREKLYYKTKSGPYTKGADLKKLVERVESFTSEENKSWTSISNEKGVADSDD